MATSTLPEQTATAAATGDTFPINGTDYIEFYVGNAKQAAHYYLSAFGFNIVAYRGPETGVRDRASYLLQQDKIRFVLTTAIRPDLSDGRIRSPNTSTSTATAYVIWRSGWTTHATPTRRRSSAAPSRCTRRASCAMTRVRSSSPPSRPMARRFTRSSSGRTIEVSSCRATGRRRRTTIRNPSASSTSTTASATSSSAR